MPRVIVLQHHEIETLGNIQKALDAAGVAVQTVRGYAHEPIPADLDQASGLIVMGGPMGVYESNRYPFLVHEQRLIAKALEAQKPILGVCLGSQLLAATLGAKVYRGDQKEIGWYELKLTSHAAHDALWQGLPENFMGFHWHGDVFEKPDGAVALASSAITPCQAFRYASHAYGLLFHMEVTYAMVLSMISHFAEEVREAGGNPQQMIEETEHYLPALQSLGQTVFARWVSLLQA